MRQPKVQKREIITTTFFLFTTDVLEVYSILLQGFERSVKEIQCAIPFCLLYQWQQQYYIVFHSQKNLVFSPENEILYNIITATDRGDRREWHIVFLSLTFQNLEEG